MTLILATGLRISWASPAAVCPSAPRRSLNCTCFPRALGLGEILQDRDKTPRRSVVMGEGGTVVPRMSERGPAKRTFDPIDWCSMVEYLSRKVNKFNMMREDIIDHPSLRREGGRQRQKSAGGGRD